MKRIWNILKDTFSRKTKEEWVATYCSDDYEVSNLGRVRSLDRIDAAGKRRKGSIKKLTKDGWYFRTTMSINGKPKTYSVHQLVYYSFNGGVPSGYDYVIDHIDGDPLNNRLDNLQKISQYDNVQKGSLNKYNLPRYVSAAPYENDPTILRYKYHPVIDGKRKMLKSSIHLEKVLAFKEQYENDTASS